MVAGIDLGTTFSAIAVLNAEGKAEIITNRDGERTTPSVVMFEDGAVIVGEQAKENSISDPLSVCQFVKRNMGNKAFSFDVSADQRYTAEEISAMIIKRLKEDAESATGSQITGAVITVPAYFDDAQRKATKDAAEIAGLHVLGIINEPTSAAVAYCHGETDCDGTVMVYDIGGGTFDITVIRLSDGLKKVDILSTAGNRNLGGFDFDNVIISKVNSKFYEKYHEDLEDDEVAIQDLRIKAENAKKALSSRPKAGISISSNGNVLKADITREEFESMIQGYLATTKASMEIAMDDAKLKWKDIDKVILVGGSTRIPAVQNMLRKESGKEPSHELNPDEAVAMGAAYYAEMLHSRETGEEPAVNKKLDITDVTSHSVGVMAINPENQQMYVDFIVKRNTALPAERNKPFRTTCNNQEEIFLQVVEGEDEDPDYDTVIGNAIIKLKPRPAGSPLDISIIYDKNGILHVRVKDRIDGADLGEMEIKRQANLSEAEIKKKTDIIGKIDIE